jgi:23S rRNA pseudouridine1911/1915/1917 synthase
MYSELFPHLSKEKWAQKIESGKITVNHEKATSHLILKAGWITQHYVNNKIEPWINTDIKLVYEDEDILVINKPSPLPIHPAGRFYKNSLTELLKLAFPSNNYKIVHRIDANTTGLLLLAKHKEIAHQLIKQFENQTIKKEYIALVEGIVQSDSFIIDRHISKHKTLAGSRELDLEGINAQTEITVLNRYEHTTLLSIKPKSGRTNQIRLHLASIHHPIVGDYGYIDQNYFKNNPMTYPDDCLFLHAHLLTLKINGKEMNFKADVPDKFKSYTLNRHHSQH